MLSNYNTKLIKELYKGYNFNYVNAQRNIGAKAKNRGIVEEVIITNYENRRGFEE
jgi:DNA adenine methylase